MFLSQVPHTPGLEVPVIVDLDPERAREACRTVGWDAARIAATAFTADGAKAPCRRVSRWSWRRPAIPPPASGMRARRSRPASISSWSMSRPTCWRGRCSREEARKAGVVYSLAYGDQPALTAEMVDWARATGFRVVAAGKGTKYLPAYHDVTPDDVWQPLRADRRRSAVGRHEPADVQLVSRRHQIGDRDGGDRECHRARRAGRRTAVSALRRRRSAACDAAARQGRRAGKVRRGGGGVVAGARRPAGVPRSALGRLCRAGGAERLCRGLLQAIRPEDRRQRPLCGDVQALSSDRARAERLDPVGGVARRADRAAASASAATSPPSPSAICAPARCSTAKAATRCGAN